MPSLRRLHGQRLDEQAASCLARGLQASFPGSHSEVGLRLVYEPGLGASSVRFFFRFPERAGLAPDHAVRSFFEVHASSVSEASSSLRDPAEPHILVVTGGEQMVELDPGEPGYTLMPFLERTLGVEWREILDGVLPSVGVALVVDVMARPVGLGSTALLGLRSEIERLHLLESAFDTEHRRSGRVADLARRSNPVAARLRGDLQKLLDMVLGGVLCEFTVRVVSPTIEAGELVGRVIASSFSSGRRFEILTISPGHPDYARALSLAREFKAYDEGERPVSAICPAHPHAEELLAALSKSDPARAVRLRHLARLSRVVDLAVASSLLGLPTSRGAAYSTMTLDTSPPAHRGGEWPALRLGRMIDNGLTLELDHRQLLRHVFCTGFTGSGKTMTIRELLRQVVEVLGVPILVLEPAKAEYRVLTRLDSRWEESLRVFTAGLENLSPLRFNPFVVPRGCTVGEHIEALVTCLAAAMPLFGPLEAFLDEGLRRAYEEVGADNDSLGEDCTRFPIMDALLRLVRTIATESGYRGEIADNLDAAIRQRIEPLTRGSVGRIFRTSQAFPAVEDLLRFPTIIELQALRREHQSFITLLYLTALLRHLRSLGPTKKLRLVIVLEEAHNLLGTRLRASGSKEEADPRGHAAEFIIKLLAEIRAYGVSIVVVDQIPSAVAPEVIKNTGIKIEHALPEGEERDIGARAALMDEAMAETLGRLLPGEAFVFFNGLYRAVQVAMEVTGLADEPPTDNELLDQLAQQRWFRDMAISSTTLALDDLFEAVRRACVSHLRALGTGEHPAEGFAASEFSFVAQTALRKLDQRVRWLGRVAGHAQAERIRADFCLDFAELLRTAADAPLHPNPIHCS